MATETRVLLAGGGTGGHVYPAIAIAEAIMSANPNAVCSFIGTRTKIEWEAVPKAGFPIAPITVSPFHRTRMWRNTTFPFKLVASLWQSTKIVKNFDPDVAVGTGGFVAGPAIWAAARRGVPVVLQEQNAFPGKTTKMLADKANQIHIAFADAKKYLPADKCVVTGNPTRKSLAGASREAGLEHFGIERGRPTLVVMGGSLGSAKLNAVVEQHQAALLEMGWSIVWQTGKLYYDGIVARTPNPPANMVIRQFIHRMDYAYAIADVALCRAGAITCAELTLTGTAAVLVPSPNVAEDHQTYNARALADKGAAILLPESEIDEEILPVLRRLLTEPESLSSLRASAKSLGRPDAAMDIAASVIEVATNARGER